MNNKLHVFLDCDGTIVDFHERFYKIYRDALIENGHIPLSKEDWIKMRKMGLHHSVEEHEIINPYFEKYFECSEYLKQDKIFPGMKEVIHCLQKKYSVKIVSFRANDVTLKEQLSNLGIHDIETITQGYNPNIAIDEKANMIRRVIPNPKGWIIGDTEYEVIAGKKLNLKTIAVTYGDRSKKTLQKYSPDFVIDYPEKILEIIK